MKDSFGHTANLHAEIDGNGLRHLVTFKGREDGLHYTTFESSVEFDAPCVIRSKPEIYGVGQHWHESVDAFRKIAPPADDEARVKVLRFTSRSTTRPSVKFKREGFAVNEERDRILMAFRGKHDQHLPSKVGQVINIIRGTLGPRFKMRVLSNQMTIVQNGYEWLYSKIAHCVDPETGETFLGLGTYGSDALLGALVEMEANNPNINLGLLERPASEENIGSIHFRGNRNWIAHHMRELLS